MLPLEIPWVYLSCSFGTIPAYPPVIRVAISDAFEPLGGAVGENDDCTFDFDELDGVELGVGLDDKEALANELEIRLY